MGIWFRTRPWTSALCKRQDKIILRQILQIYICWVSCQTAADNNKALGDAGYRYLPSPVLLVET